MVTSDDVREVGLALPRTYEAFIRRRWKLKVKQLVYVAFSRDEQLMGFGFPREERDGLISGDPETFLLPRPADLRYRWVVARLARLGHDEMRELVTDAWRMCVPRMLHELPELPAPTARVWDLVEQERWDEVHPLLHPQVRWTERGAELRGPDQVLGHLQSLPRVRPPGAVTVRAGRIHRWEA